MFIRNHEKILPIPTLTAYVRGIYVFSHMHILLRFLALFSQELLPGVAFLGGEFVFESDGFREILVTGRMTADHFS